MITPEEMEEAMEKVPGIFRRWKRMTRTDDTDDVIDDDIDDDMDG